MKKKTEKENFFKATGRRKTATATVFLWPKEGEILINKKPLSQYFSSPILQEIVLSPLKVAEVGKTFKILVNVKGGGKMSQAEAIRHGISQALVKYSPELKPKLKKVGFLRRDPRMKERKKFGLKRARRAPQWQKR
jgi:small subunit ribosomal protein S9